MKVIEHFVYRDGNDLKHHDIKLLEEGGAYAVLWGFRYLMDPIDTTLVPIPNCIDPTEFLDGMHKAFASKGLTCVPMSTEEVA